MPFPSRSILVSGETYERLVRIAAEMKERDGKAVTFSEVVEELLGARN